MKKIAAAAVAATALLAVSACTAPTEQAAPETTAAPTVEVVEPTESADPTLDIEQVKAEAIASGRPEAAWDINCVAWELPEADSEAQEWANELGLAYLASQDASCPDAVTSPMYFMETFEPGTSSGQVVIKVDDSINELMHGDHAVELEWMTYYFFDAIADEHPEVSAVTAKTISGQRAVTLHRADLEAARQYGGPLPDTAN